MNEINSMIAFLEDQITRSKKYEMIDTEAKSATKQYKYQLANAETIKRKYQSAINMFESIKESQIK